MSAQDPIRVLICDDEALVRTGWDTIVSAQPDMAVAGHAEDGEQAVAEALRLQPDVVVMDIRMPAVDGVEATRRLAGPDVGCEVKVLAVTNFNLDEHVVDAFRAGASGFLLKDAPPEELLRAIRVVASGDALIAPSVTRQLIGRFGSRLASDAPAAEADEADDAVRELTRREREVVELVAAGRSNAEIASELVLSPETVKTYVSRILAKLELRDRVQIVIFAYQHGVVD